MMNDEINTREMPSFDPQEAYGLVFDCPKEEIAGRIARETARVGSLELWQYQAFVHHEHPVGGAESDPLRIEPELAREWGDVLRERFPAMEFIIETAPLETMTWFQATPRAPREDDPEFEDHSPPVIFRTNASGLKKMLNRTVDDLREAVRDVRTGAIQRERHRSGSVGVCERCGADEGYSAPKVAPEHRGIRTVSCLACGERLVHSTRTIRDRIGPA